MVNALSTYASDALLNWLKGTSLPALPQTWHAFFNGDPEDGGTEVTATIRPAGRLQATMSAPAGPTALCENTGILDYGDADAGATTDWAAIFTAASAGNLLWKGSGTSKTIAAGEGVRVPAGGLQISSAGTLAAAVRESFMKWLTGHTAGPAAPGSLYIGVFNGNPEAGGTEVTFQINSLGRKQIALGNIVAKELANTLEVDFGIAENNVTYNYFTLHTAASGGSLVSLWAVPERSLIAAEDALIVRVGEFKIKIS